MAANTITRGRLRALADVRPERGRVLSVFLNLDPAEFATPAARSTAITSVVTEAAHRVDDAEDLEHDERVQLRADVERVRERLERAVDVVGLDHEVEVVARLRTAARPARQAAAEQERDLRLAQRRGGALERVLDLGKRLLV